MVNFGGAPATNVPVYATSAAGQLDFNQWGYPAQQWPLPEDSPRLNNVEDCISVWSALLQSSPTVSDGQSADYRAEYINTDQCRYDYNALPQLSIYYNSQNGEVTVDDDPNT